jgi:hypothetical protein
MAKSVFVMLKVFVVASIKREVTPCSLVYRCPCFSGNLLPLYSGYRQRQKFLLNVRYSSLLRKKALALTVDGAVPYLLGETLERGNRDLFKHRRL